MNHPHPRTRRRRALLLAGAAAVGIVVLAACSGSKPKAAVSHSFNPLSSTTTSTVDPNALHLPAGFQLPDTRFVSLAPVTGKAQPRPAIPVTGGKATISGTVTGPGGAVAGATVRIERWVGSDSGAIMVGTDGGGHYVAAGVLGGHYKVRAWLQPSLTTFTAGTGFVADSGKLSVDLPLTQYNAYTVQVAATSGAATVGQPFTVEALVTQQTVDPNGVVQDAPVPTDQVQLSSDPSVTIAGANPGTTGADGLVSWTLTCQTAGGFTASATASQGSGSTSLPPCQATPTTEAPPTVLPLAVGQSFTVPAAGPFPAGQYSAPNPACSVTYEVYVNGAWQPAHNVGNSLTLAGPGQAFVADTGPPHCVFTRLS